MFDAIIEADKQLFRTLNQEWYLEALDPIIVFLTVISDIGIFWYIIAIYLLLFPRKAGGYLPGISLAVSVAFVFLLQHLVNLAVPRPRPPLTEEGVRQLVEAPLSPSFPSGHASTSFAAAAVLMYFYPSAKYWALPLAAIFAYSRLYIGVHFPIDSAAGVLLGILTGLFIVKLFKFIRQKRQG